MITDEQFTRRLELALSHNSLNQSGLASKLGVSPQLISDIKRGKTPGYARLVEIAEALNCSVEWLTQGEGYQPDWLNDGGGLSAGELADKASLDRNTQYKLLGAKYASAVRANEKQRKYGEAAPVLENDTLQILVETNARLVNQLEVMNQRLARMEDQLAAAQGREPSRSDLVG